MIFSGHRISDCIGEDFESDCVMLLRLAARWAFFAAAIPFCLPHLLAERLRTWEAFRVEGMVKNWSYRLKF